MRGEYLYCGVSYKRLSAGRFRWWPSHAQDRAPSLEAFQLQMLLAGADPTAARGAAVWRRVSPPP